MPKIVNSDETVYAMAQDSDLRDEVQKIYNAVAKYRYTYNFNWLGRPIIQLPQDIVAMQELIWEIKPDIVIECGVAHGGSLVLYASILEIIGKSGKVIGVDIDIREHNRKALESHPLGHRIVLIQGSSTDEAIVEMVKKQIKGHETVLVTLDSNHTREHVKAELELYSPMVTKGSYLVVFDTLIEDMPDDTYPGKPWRKGNNPKTAVFEFLKENHRFEIDYDFEAKLMLTVAPSGYLKKVL